MIRNKNSTLFFNKTPYITSETYHALNRNSSDKYIIRSTSSLFCDLDSIAKRHSYHCVPLCPVSDSKIEESNTNVIKNGFKAKSQAIVQECATQVHPKFKRLDSSKKISKQTKTGTRANILSSEILLRDNDYTQRKSNCYLDNKNDLRQKIWSYAKYRTEYTNPILEVETCEKKNRGKRTEDPCPCQLFSYACPCTARKSLTELAKNSKGLTVADQITSTPKFILEVENNNKKYSKNQKSKYCEENYTNNTGSAKKYETTATVYGEPITNKNNTPKVVEDKQQHFMRCMESRSHKKPKQVVCPNCKEILEILITDDEDGYKFMKPLQSQNGTSSPSESKNYNNNNVDETDICIHNPPCELVPLCQILPPDDTYNINSKCVRRVSVTKHNPKMIKITKACRHNPPCLVVPSCQRLYVLKNKCEHVPPCLHRPRCINVPLCVPVSKVYNYEDLLNKKIDDTDNIECNHFPPCNLMSAYQQKPLHNYTNQTCEYVSEFSPRFVLSPEMQCMSPTFLPYQVPNQPCKYCMSNKTCQYDCLDCKCIPSNGGKECASSDDVIYIRDVGCQFRSDNFTPNGSLLQSKNSSVSFDLTSATATAGNYNTNFSALRYENKSTNPISVEELSFSAFTTSSLEIDDDCPSHGTQSRKKRSTGFRPQSTESPFVTAFSSCKDPILKHSPISEEVSGVTSKSDTLSIDTLTYLTTFPSKSRRSGLKGKHKKVYSIRQRKKSKQNNALKSKRTDT